MQATIYLGSRCNMNCAYCHREANEKEDGISDDFIQKLKNMKPERVKFMGGEPTLYMEEIKNVVAALPDAEYAISTNGMNLEEYLPYFKKHRFLIVISYDGCENKERGYDPFTKLIDYPWLAVSTTIYHGNTDFKAILKSFAEKERIIGRRLSFFPHMAHHTNNANSEFALTKEDAEVVIGEFKEMVGSYMKDFFLRGIRNIRYEGMYNGLYRRYKARYLFGETYCVNHKLMKFNSKGEAFDCLYIRDHALEGDWQSSEAKLIAENFPACRTCSVYFMCGAGCVKSKNRAIDCYIKKSIYTWFKDEYESYKEAGYAD